MKTNDAKSKLL